MGEGEGGGGKVMNFKVLKSFSPPLHPLFQRGGFLPFVKGGKEGFSLLCPYNYGLTNINFVRV